RAVEECEPLLVVAHQDADVVAAADAHRLHGPGGAFRPLEELLIGKPSQASHQRLALAAGEHLAERLRFPAQGLPIHCPDASCSSIAAISTSRAPFGSRSMPWSMERLASLKASGGALRIAAWIFSL